MKRRDERGATAVEFAVVFTLVILPLLLGIIQYGYQYWSLETASAAAREAARRLAVGGDPCKVAAAARDQAAEPSIGAVTVTYAARTSPSASNDNSAYNGAVPPVGRYVEVTVSFDSFKLGLLPLPSGGHVTQTAEALIQSQHQGTAADPFVDINGNLESGAAPKTWPAC